MTAYVSLKKGVRLSNLAPQMAVAILIAAGCYGARGVRQLVVTSCNDSKHGWGSLHFSGNAVDLRSKNVPRGTLDALVMSLKSALGADCDVVLEDRDGDNEHIHAEYQPKK